MYLTNNTQFFISIILPETIYLTVTAMNVLGNGEPSCFTGELNLTLLLQLSYLKGIFTIKVLIAPQKGIVATIYLYMMLVQIV